jgi:hypothetical protein
LKAKRSVQENEGLTSIEINNKMQFPKPLPDPEPDQFKTEYYQTQERVQQDHIFDKEGKSIFRLRQSVGELDKLSNLKNKFSIVKQNVKETFPNAN